MDREFRLSIISSLAEEDFCETAAKAVPLSGERKWHKSAFVQYVEEIDSFPFNDCSSVTTRRAIITERNSRSVWSASSQLLYYQLVLTGLVRFQEATISNAREITSEHT